MKKIIVGIILLLFPFGSVFAQQSVGFSDPDDIDPLLDYRLPDWGYSNFYFDVSAANSGRDSKSSGNTSFNNRINTAFNPHFDLFRESEARIIQLNTALDISYDDQLSKSSYDRKRTSNSLGTEADITANVREYMSEQVFLFAEGALQFDYSSTKNETEDNQTLTDKQLTYDRIFRTTPKLGIGFGRIRNVSPVIRAMRLRERAGAVNKGLSFGEEDVLATTDQMTRYQGYQRRYDRPSKHFWGDLDRNTNVDLRSLNAFDMLYLTDVLDEAIGTRLEGWELLGGVQFNYYNNLERTEEPTTQLDPVSRDVLVDKGCRICERSLVS
ncbi:MAG: hypothetical protein ACQEST_06850 [Bacteroidota bacterium]